MSLETLNAYAEGYSDQLFDQQLIAIQTGFWAGYYSNAKHPKSLKNVLKDMAKKHLKSKKSNKSHQPEVDVDSFLAMESRFKEKLNSKQ